MLKGAGKDGQGPPKTVTTDGSKVEWSKEFLEVLADYNTVFNGKNLPKKPLLIGDMLADKQKIS